MAASSDVGRDATDPGSGEGEPGGARLVYQSDQSVGARPGGPGSDAAAAAGVKPKSGAQIEADAIMAAVKAKTKKIASGDDARSQRLPDAARKAFYPVGVSDIDHAKLARFEQVPLSSEDAAYASAHVTNQSGIEYLSRMGPHTPDDLTIDGRHFGPDQLGAVIHNLGIDIEALRKDSHYAAAERLEELQKAVQASKDRGTSRIFVIDSPERADELRDGILTEEVNHAVQRAETGPLQNHLGSSARGFLASPAAIRALGILKDAGYDDLDTQHGRAAAELGAALMQPGRYQELKLSLPEARALADDYMARLEKEYGSEATPEIRRRIAEALGR